MFLKFGCTTLALPIASVAQHANYNSSIEYQWISQEKKKMHIKAETETTVHTCYKKCDVINSGPKSSCQSI